MDKDLDDEEAFVASSFVEFHTQESPDGSYIPMTDEEAQERFFGWLRQHDREVSHFAWLEGAKWGAEEFGDISPVDLTPDESPYWPPTDESDINDSTI